MKRLFLIITAILFLLSLVGCDQFDAILQQVSAGTSDSPPAATAQLQPQITATSPTKMVLITNTPEAEIESPTETPMPKALEPIWVINQADRAILRIDPDSNEVLIKIHIGGLPKALAVGDDSIWVVEAIDDERSNVLRINTAMNQVTSSIPIIQGAATSLAVGEDAVWVGIAEPAVVDPAPEGEKQNYSQPGGIAKIDIQRNQIVEYIETEALVADLILEDQILWALEWKYIYTFIDKIDLSTEPYMITSLAKEAEMLDYVHQFAGMAKSKDSLWMLPIDNSSRYVFRVRPDDGKIISQVELGNNKDDTPTSITATENDIWVGTQSGKIIRIDNDSEQIVANIQTSSGNYSEIFTSEDSIWAVSYEEAFVYRVSLDNQADQKAIESGSKILPTETPTITPTFDPNNPIPWDACKGTYQSRLQVGIRAKVNEDPPLPNRVRDNPNLDANIIGQIDAGQTIEIISGPTCSNQWIWWFVRDEYTGLTGWTSEGDVGNNYWLSPFSED
ncbi:MAG: SH3 domain-containing protein [Anaerolineaceae bacterium]|nr:SH3 domain-containing protein [Anaerolineaceae bacterium]